MDCAKAETLARELMRLHGLDSVGSTCEPRQPWHFGWMRRTNTCGIAHFGKRAIMLSAPIVKANEESEVRDTILHEIAHVLAGPSGHGQVWKLKAMEIGARPYACTDTANVPKGKYFAVCAACGHEHQGYRKRIGTRLCGAVSCRLLPASERRLTFIQRY